MPAVKALVFLVVHFLAVHRMRLAKNPSWELANNSCKSLFVRSRQSAEIHSYCITHMQHDKRLKICLNHAHKKLFKELSLKRFLISVFIFENHCAVFFF